MIKCWKSGLCIWNAELLKAGTHKKPRFTQNARDLLLVPFWVWIMDAVLKTGNIWLIIFIKYYMNVQNKFWITFRKCNAISWIGHFHQSKMFHKVCLSTSQKEMDHNIQVWVTVFCSSCPQPNISLIMCNCEKQVYWAKLRWSFHTLG